jgi:hypothetical protein
MSKRGLLSVGVFAPAIYLSLIAAGGLLFPGYDHARQMVSELGGPEAPHPAVFNLGLMLTGGLTVLASGVLFNALRERGGALLASLLAALAIAVFGASLLIGGLYPLPDERHLAWGMGFAVQVAPLLTAWALWRAPDMMATKAFLLASFIAVNGLLAVMFGVGDLIDGDNVGLWQRAYGLAMFVWIAVTSLALMRRPGARLLMRTA